MAKLVSKTYGDALFELALEENKIDSLQEEVEAVLVALAENQDLGKLMNHPKISKEVCSATPHALCTSQRRYHGKRWHKMSAALHDTVAVNAASILSDA